MERERSVSPSLLGVGVIVYAWISAWCFVGARFCRACLGAGRSYCLDDIVVDRVFLLSTADVVYTLVAGKNACFFRRAPCIVWR